MPKHYDQITPLKNGKFKVRFRVNGVARSKTVPSLRQALDYRAAQAKAKADGTAIDPKRSRVKFGAFVVEYYNTKDDVSVSDPSQPPRPPRRRS